MSIALRILSGNTRDLSILFFNSISCYLYFDNTFLSLIIVDGEWSDWSIGSCSVSCVKEKTRSCTDPVPSCGGKSCNGPAVETVTCAELPCKGLQYIDI